MTNEEFLKDVCPNHTEKSKWNRNELLHILELHEKQLRIGGVGSSNKVDYKQGFELAQNYISESPCDPDIYKTQLEAWDKYQQFLIDNNIT